MKNIVKKISPFVFIFLLISCDRETIKVSDSITEVKVNVGDYSGVKVSDAFTVYLTFDDNEESIVVEANANLQSSIIVEKDDDYLRIKVKNNTNIKGDAVMNVYISTASINEIYAAGATQVVLNNQWVNPISKIELSGASNLMGEIEMEELELNASGASNVDLYGSLGSLKSSLAGSSHLKDFDLNLASLEIDLSGASTASLSVSEVIKVHASGASLLYYKGDAIIEEQELSGSSQVKKISSL